MKSNNSALSAKSLLKFLEEQIICPDCNREDCDCPPGECTCEPLPAKEEPKEVEPPKEESFYPDDYKRDPETYILVTDVKVTLGDAEILIVGGYRKYKDDDFSWAVTSTVKSKSSDSGSIVAFGSAKSEDEAVKAIKKYDNVRVK